MTRPPVTPLPASTVLLLRDGAETLEVFMVRRPDAMDFASGALVFPGGKVDPEDREVALRGRCAGVDGVDDTMLALQVAAIRETFEECGVLLARPRGSDRLVEPQRVHALLARYRAPLVKDEIGIGAMIEAEDLELACDLLVRFAHWITPEMRPKRFDTHFFLAPAPEGQQALHDGMESLDSLWTNCEGAIDSFHAGTHYLMFPTYANLKKLGRSRQVSEAMQRARAAPVVSVLGTQRRGPDGLIRMVVPRDAGYDLTEVPDPQAPSGKRLVVYE